jgi:hypothetical protein
MVSCSDLSEDSRAVAFARASISLVIVLLTSN